MTKSHTQETSPTQDCYVDISREELIRLGRRLFESGIAYRVAERWEAPIQDAFQAGIVTSEERRVQPGRPTSDIIRWFNNHRAIDSFHVLRVMMPMFATCSGELPMMFFADERDKRRHDYFLAWIKLSKRMGSPRPVPAVEFRTLPD